MNGGLSLAIPCRADEPGLGATLASLQAACQHPALPTGLIEELLVCINGLASEATSAPVLAVRAFCARRGIPLREVWLDSEGGPTEAQSVQPVASAEMFMSRSRTLEGENDAGAPRAACPPVRTVFEGRQGMAEAAHSPPIPRCTLLCTARRGKPPAWNALWRRAAGTIVLFCDADVRVDPEAVWFLQARLQSEPHLLLAAAREVPVLEGRGTMWSRMGALPYRFDFGNAGGRLLLLRKEALPEGMPEDLLLEDAWLTIAVGKHRVAKEGRARVYFLPPASGRDYFAERVRTEGGKLQLRRVHGKLLEGGPIATYRWPRFFKEIALSEYPLVLLSLVTRGAAHIWARLALINKEFYALYRPFLTTKDWSET